jgi:ATP synthase protein I
LVAKKVNKRGWWGILLHASWPTLAAVLLTGGIFGLVEGAAAAWSAIVAGGIVWFLSALTVLFIAIAWRKHRNRAIPIALATFVLKIIILGLLLAVVPQPAWLHATGAAVGALVAIVVWQVAEVLVFINTRRLIYA